MNHPVKAAESDKLRVLVIQLARLGDTLQTLMALRAAKQLYPQMEIHLVVRERFSEAAKRVPWISKVICFPSDKLIGPVIVEGKSEAEMLPELAKWVLPLVNDRWDMVLNWSFSEASSYLSAIIPARIKLGYSRRKDLSFSSVDGWSHYIQSIVQSGLDQNIHLTDILTTQLLTALQIHVGEPVKHGEDNAVLGFHFFRIGQEHEFIQNEEFQEFQLENDHAKRWIALQLGASTDLKSYEPENYAKLVNLILSQHPDTGFIILGTDADRARANRFFSRILPNFKGARGNDKRVFDFVGKTSFDLWTYLIGRCQWLFSGDTAAVHVASILGTRVLNISIGNVKYLETGPYGNGHIVITARDECAGCQSESKTASEHSCLERISPEAVFAVWAQASVEKPGAKKQVKPFEWPKVLEGTQVYRSRIRPISEGGGITFEAVAPFQITEHEWNAIVVGHIARAWYCGWTPDIGHELDRSRIRPDFIVKVRETRQILNELTQILVRAHRVALEVIRVSKKLKSQTIMSTDSRDQLREIASKLSSLDIEFAKVSESSRVLRIFSNMLRVILHNLNGTAVSELGQETAQAYEQLLEGLKCVDQWIGHTLDLAKPAVVEGANILSFPNRSQEKTIEKPGDKPPTPEVPA